MELKVGDRVFWNDPDPDPDSNCSGPGVVTSINGLPIDDDSIIAVQKDDGGEVEAPPWELEKERGVAR